MKRFRLPIFSARDLGAIPALAIGFAMSPLASAISASWDGSDGNWTDAGRWTSAPDYPNNDQPAPGDTWSVTIGSGDVTRNIAPTISTLNFSGGRILGSGNLTVTGSMTWSGGLLAEGDLLCDGSLTISGAARLYGTNAEATLASGNTGTISGSGNLSLENQTKFTNQGTLRARNDNGISEQGPFQSNFTNTGTFVRDVSSGVFTLGATQVNNSGTYQIQTGTLAITEGITNSGSIQISSGAALRIDGGSIFETGTSISGTGELRFTSGEQNIHPALTIPNPVRLDSEGQLTIYDGNTLTLNGDFNWNGGKLSRESDFFGGTPGHVTLGGITSIGGGSELFGVTVSNGAAATAILYAGETLDFLGDAVFANTGTFSLGAESVLQNTGGGNSFSNSGLVVATAMGNAAQIGVPLSNTGTVSASAGILTLSGGGSSTGAFQAEVGSTVQWTGDYTFNPGTSFTGDGSFWLVSGNHTLTGSLAASADFLIASDLTVPAAATFTHGGTLSFGGNLTGAGSLVSNGDLNIFVSSITGSTLRIGSGSNAIQSSIFLEDSIVTLNNGGILLNDGTLTASSTGGAGGIAKGTGSGNRFENNGTFIHDSDTETYTISATLANTGTMRIDDGHLIASGGGTSTGGSWELAAGTIAELRGTFAFSGTNSVTGTGAWVLGTDGGGGSAVTHTLAGTLTLGAPVTLGNATLSLNPSATITATAPFDALKGSLTGGGTLHADGDTTIGDLTVNAATLDLESGSETIHASTSPLVLAAGGAVTNTGDFKARGDFSLFADQFGIAQGTGAAGSFSNSGTFTRDAGAGQYGIGVPFHNSGTVSSQSGMLALVAGGSSTNGTWDATGGQLVFEGDFTFDGSTTMIGTTPPIMGDGAHTVNGPFASAPGLTLTGLANLAVQPMQTASISGLLEMSNSLASIPTVSGGGAVNADGGMTVIAGAIDGATLNLGAMQTASHAGAGSLTLKNGGVFNNAGIYQASGDGFLGEVAAPGNIFHNIGTFTRDTSAGVFTVSAPFDNTGTTTAAAGTLSFAGTVTSTGTFAPAPGGIIAFAGTSNFDHATPFTDLGEVRFTAGTHGFVQSGTIAPMLTLSGGTLNVAAATTLDLTAISHLTGGTVAGGGTLQTTGGIDLSGPAVLDATTLVVPAGTHAFQTLTGNLTLNGAAVLSNAGTWHAANALGILVGTGTGQTLNNSGTFIRDTDAGTFTVGVPLHNTGTVSVATGVLALQGSGTSSGAFDAAAETDLSLSGSNTFSAGAAFTGAGRINLTAGTQTVGATMASAAIVNLSGATLSIQPSQVFQSNGAFHWTAGPVTGGGILETSGALDLTATALALDGATLSSTVTGSITISSAGSLVLTNGGILENLGTTMLLNDGSITAGDASAVAFNNSGTLTRDTGTGLFTLSVPFNHSGTLNLNTGSLRLNGGGTASNSLIQTQAGTALHVGTNYTFGPDNFITGPGATHFSNGSLHVTGSLTTDGSFNWTGGTLDGGGTFTVKGGLTITPGTGAVNINGATLENALGSEAVISGTQATVLLNGGTYRNSGATRLRGNNNFSDGGGGTNRIVNTGTLERDQGTGNYTITVPVENSGLIRSTAGKLYLNAGGNISGGSLDATGGDIYLNGGAYSFAGGALAGTGWIYLTAGSATVDADTGATTGPATGGFGLSGGSLGGTAMLSVERGYFATGTISGSPTVRLTGQSNKAINTLNMNGGTILNDGVWDNIASGTINLDSSTGGGAGTLVNKGTWRLNGAVSYNNTYGGGQVENHGLFECVTGNSSIDGAVHHRAGSVFRVLAGQMLLIGGGSMETGATLDAAGGIIYLYDGTHTWTGGTITGNSYVYSSNTSYTTVAGEVGAATGPATGGFGVTGGTLTGTGTVSADRGYFSNGLIGGSVTVRLTGNTTTAGAGNTLNMNGGTILNEGTWINSASGTINLDSSTGGSAGTIINQGTWKLNGAVSYNNTYSGGQVVNHGVFECVSGNSSISAAVLHRAGSLFRVTLGQMLLSGGGSLETGATLDAAGGIIYLSGGSHAWTGGTIIGNSYVYCSGGTTTVSGEVGAASGAATGGFGVTGGTLTGTETVSADHGYFSTGLIGGSVTVRLTGASTKAASTTLNMNGGTILNEGTWTNAAAGTINLDSATGGGAGTIVNQGTWRLSGAAGYNNSNGGGQVENHGLFECVTGNSSIDALVHHRDGSVFRVLAGQMLLTGGGSLEAGATLDAAGGIIYLHDGTHTWTGGTLTGNSYVYCNNTGYTTVSGEVGAASGPATGGFGVTGGTLTGTGTVSADHGYFSTGNIGGSVTVRFTGVAIKASSTTLNMSGGTIRNEGVFTHQASGTINLDNSTGAGGGTIHNLGTWNIAGAVSFNNTNNGGAFLNPGTLTVATGSSTLSAAMTNSGLIQVNGGTLSMSKGSVHTGRIVANGGITFGAGTHTMSGTSAYLGGSGYSTGTLAISDGASIRPGNSAGNFTNYGTLTFTTGGANPSVVVELASAASFDTITLANSSVLALGSGLTDLTVQPLYQPAPGTVYRIITAGTGTGVRTGTFRNAPTTGSLISGTSGTITAWFRVTYDGAGKYVELTALDPYDAWAESKGLSGGDAGFHADPDGDGISNGIEFVIGSEPNPANPAWDSRALLPTMELDETYLRFVFRRSQVSATYVPACHYSGNLTAWTKAEDDINGVDILETPNGFATGIDRVELLIPRSLATDGRLFARLQVQESP